jgi:ABC-2 type transport system permease protein
MVQPVAAVFYPVSAMPGWLQVVAWALPCSHIFEGMREVVDTGRLPLGMLAWAAALNAVWLAGAGAVYLWVFRYVRRHGLVSKVVSR